MSDTPMGKVTVLDVYRIQQAVTEELAQQFKKHPGTDDYPDGTGAGSGYVAMAKATCDRAQREGNCTFRMVLDEEHAEAMVEKDPAALRKELVQVAAVAFRWIAAIDRRKRR